MLFRPLIAAAGLATVTQAFLLPPDISAADIEIVDALPIEATLIADHQLMSIDCPGCPPVFQKEHHGTKKHHKSHSSHLKLDFAIDHTLESDRLVLNGFELYPHSDPFSNILTAPQISDKKEHHKDHRKDHKGHKKGDNSKTLQSHHKWSPHRPHMVDQQLGFSLQSHAVAKSADEALDLVVVDLQIIEVGSTFVNGLPNVRVHLVKTPDSKLMIAKIEETTSETLSDPINQEDCTTMLCKWRAIIAEQMNKVKQGCTGMSGSKAGSPPHHHNMGQDHEGRHHAWGLLMKKLTSHILLPVAIGIIAGVTVSIIGMIIGTLIVGLWRKVVRGQSFFPGTHRRHHKTPQKEAVIEEEKSGLLAEETEELPPAYEDEEVKNTSVV